MVVHGLLRFHACRASSFRLEQLLENSDSSEFSLFHCEDNENLSSGKTRPRETRKKEKTRAVRVKRDEAEKQGKAKGRKRQHQPFHVLLQTFW